MCSDYYFKIYLYKGKLSVVNLSYIDESDYEESCFVRNEDGTELRFYDEDEAVKYLNDNFQAQFIDDFFLFHQNKINSMRKTKC